MHKNQSSVENSEREKFIEMKSLRKYYYLYFESIRNPDKNTAVSFSLSHLDWSSGEKRRRVLWSEMVKIFVAIRTRFSDLIRSRVLAKMINRVRCNWDTSRILVYLEPPVNYIKFQLLDI